MLIKLGDIRVHARLAVSRISDNALKENAKIQYNDDNCSMTYSKSSVQIFYFVIYANYGIEKGGIHSSWYTLFKYCGEWIETSFRKRTMIIIRAKEVEFSYDRFSQI